MSVIKELETSVESPEEIFFPSGEFLSDEPVFDNYQHLQQIMLLIKCLDWWWRERQDFFCASNLTIYYSRNQPKSKDFRGPDFFVVLGVDRQKPRNSWVVWQEDGKYPNIIVEIMSEITADKDRGLKKQVYQEIFRIPDYFWFDPETLEFAGFVLVSGKYEALKPNSQGHLWSQQLEMYLGIHEKQLRFFTPEGTMVPTPEDAANLVLERAELELIQQRVYRLAAKLRELGIDPNSL